MKTFLFIAGFIVNINAYAFTQNANLDFTNLYGSTNAGKYTMSVTLTPKTTKSFSGLNYSNHHDDNDIYCVTTAKFEIGQMSFTLKNVETGWTFQTSKTLEAGISFQSNSETCMTDISKFAGSQSLYAALGLNQEITLPAKAPFDYQKVGAYLAPFNGYLYLNAALLISEGQLVIDPRKLLTEKSVLATNKNNASVTYSVFATNDTTTLSLGNGLVKF